MAIEPLRHGKHEGLSTAANLSSPSRRATEFARVAQAMTLAPATTGVTPPPAIHDGTANPRKSGGVVAVTPEVGGKIVRHLGKNVRWNAALIQKSLKDGLLGRAACLILNPWCEVEADPAGPPVTVGSDHTSVQHDQSTPQSSAGHVAPAADNSGAANLRKPPAVDPAIAGRVATPPPDPEGPFESEPTNRVAPKKVDGPRFDALRDHFIRHGPRLGNSSPNAYYNQAVQHMNTGRPFAFRHEGVEKMAYVTRLGRNSFMFTSTTRGGGRILTHFEVNGRYLRNNGITLPRGF